MTTPAFAMIDDTDLQAEQERLATSAAELDRSIALLKRAMQMTRDLRVLLNGHSTELSFKFHAPMAEVERSLAYSLLRRDEIEDLRR